MSPFRSVISPSFDALQWRRRPLLCGMNSVVWGSSIRKLSDRNAAASAPLPCGNASQIAFKEDQVPSKAMQLSEAATYTDHTGLPVRFWFSHSVPRASWQCPDCLVPSNDKAKRQVGLGGRPMRFTCIKSPPINQELKLSKGQQSSLAYS